MRRKTFHASRKLSRNRRRNTFKKRKNHKRKLKKTKKRKTKKRINKKYKQRGGKKDTDMKMSLFGNYDCANNSGSLNNYKYLKRIDDKSGKIRHSSRYVIKIPQNLVGEKLLSRFNSYSIRYKNFKRLFSLIKRRIRPSFLSHNPTKREEETFETLSKNLNGLNLPEKSQCLDRAVFIDDIFKYFFDTITTLSNLEILGTKYFPPETIEMKPVYRECRNVLNGLGNFRDVL